MSTTHAVFILIGAALILTAGALAIPGWLTDRPDSSMRYRLRFLSMLALLAGWLLIHTHPHGLLDWTLQIVTVFWLIDRIQHWYRATEKARKAEAEHARLVAALRSGRPMWLPNDGRGVSGD